MRRMIPGKLIEKIKSLFTSLWSDDEGNVEVGKNLEVDGNSITNGFGQFGDLSIMLDKFDDSSGMNITHGDYDFVFELYNGEEPKASIDFSTPNADGTIEFIEDSQGRRIVLGGDFDVEVSKTLKVNGVPFDLYRHHLTLTTASGTDCQDYYSHSNLVVDSIQDLTTITGGHPFGSGTGYTYASNVWKHGSANVTAVADDVQLVTN